jgi:transposase
MLTREQFKKIEGYMPKRRGDVRIDNYVFMRAVVFMLENGCKWRALPVEYGKWYTIYRRMARWASTGALERVFTVLQKEGLLAVNIEILALDSTAAKVHPDAHGAPKKRANSASVKAEADGTRKFMLYPLMISIS